MLYGGHLGGLEVRQGRGGGFRLRGSFPYNSRAILSDGGRNGGRPKKEQFAARAFAFNVENDTDILFLSGHRFDKPLASRAAGTLDLTDGNDALSIEATITEEMQQTTWARDFMAAFGAGLVIGLSPGFRLPPQRTVPNAETVAEEDPKDGNAIIRTITAALLFEISAVTKAAYPDAQITARNWQPGRLIRPAIHPAMRWR